MNDYAFLGSQTIGHRTQLTKDKKIQFSAYLSSMPTIYSRSPDVNGWGQLELAHQNSKHAEGWFLFQNPEGGGPNSDILFYKSAPMVPSIIAINKQIKLSMANFPIMTATTTRHHQVAAAQIGFVLSWPFLMMERGEMKWTAPFSQVAYKTCKACRQSVQD